VAPAGGAATGGSGGVEPEPACSANAADAYQGTPATIPGTVEAEDFDTVGYSDSTDGNEGGAHRAEVDVDIKELGSGYAIGWMTSGEWLEYTVNVAEEGDYSLTIRAGAVDAGRALELSQCGTTLLDPITIPQVDAWGEVLTVNAGSIHLAAGPQVLRFTVGGSDSLDFDSFSIGTGAEGTGGTTGSGGAGTGGGAGTETGGADTGGSSSGGSGPGTVQKFVGNITTGWNGALDTNGYTFSEYWDEVTPENAGKWGPVQSTPSSGFNWNTLDSIYDYTERTGILFKQHCFLWGSQQPEPQSQITETHVKTWMKEFCQRYPNTRLIDVVNEPPPHTTPGYTNAIGGGTNGDWKWIANAFVWAREACPDAILILNDYNNVEWQDQTQHFIDIVKAIQAAGAPIDAIGAQSHGLSNAGATDTMKRLMTKMHDDTGLPVYVTEYDINQSDDNAQLARYQEHIPFFMETEWIHGVTVWGWIYGSTWVASSGIIRDGTPRPAMTWLMEYLGRPAP